MASSLCTWGRRASGGRPAPAHAARSWSASNALPIIGASSPRWLRRTAARMCCMIGRAAVPERGQSDTRHSPASYC